MAHQRGAGARQFEFAEVEGPSDVFDPDERALPIALPASNNMVVRTDTPGISLRYVERAPEDVVARVAAAGGAEGELAGCRKSIRAELRRAVLQTQ